MRINRFLEGKFSLSLVMAFAGSLAIYSQIRPAPWNQLTSPLPDPLRTAGGEAITTPLQWESTRREEVLELFRDHLYGRVPEMDLEVTHHVRYLDMNALSGTAVMKEVEVELTNGRDTLAFSILVFLPGRHSGPAPLFVGLNFNGNHTIHPDPEISLTESWVGNNDNFGITDNRATPQSRGASASRWPVELILSRGYGLATVYCGDIDPDFDDGFNNGVHRLAQGSGSGRDPSSWGTIAAWAWGLSRCMDYFEKDADIDAGRVAVIGHSRLGKTALWAGAQDERFALVISNNSGCGGAALSRRDFGESVSVINERFPHWFAAEFRNYGHNEAALPVDQHMLMALVAPRPLYVASAEEDAWADPYGEYLSLYYGSRVYGLYGEGVLEQRELPQLDHPLVTGRLGYHIRTGGHDITGYDWEQYLDFADRHMRPDSVHPPANPVTMEWLKEKLRAGSPRLILTPEVESAVRRKLEAGDRVTTEGLRLLHQAADQMLDLEPLAFRKTGRRLLGVSREAIRRLTTLALVYRFDREEEHLIKLEEELRSVCSFEHWNPSHFLDVAEMATGVALALDWAGEWISPEVNRLARESLIEKAVKPGIAASVNNWWVDVHHNWNLVCNGGMAMAGLAIFEDEPELASRVICQAVEKIPLGLQPYAPGGIYPEGPSYWFYATTYLTAVISAFESSLGTDFGFADAPGVMESAGFSQVLAGPGGEYYNYFDAGLEGFHSLEHFGLLAWFSKHYGCGVDMDSCIALLEEELSGPRRIRGDRFFSTHFLNLALTDQNDARPFSCPETWIAGGDEPLGIFRDPENGPGAFFLAAKGGRAADNHGNMDAGSFIFELDGVRWSVDPGNQGYYELEQILGEGLWDISQDSPRWSLLTKNNSGHSTITVNGKRHLVGGRAGLVRIDLRTPRPEFTFDLTPLFGEDLGKDVRTFSRIPGNRLVITDELVPSAATENITWQMITRAGVTEMGDKLMLQQAGKTLYIHLPSEPPCEVHVTDLSPPPLTYDKDIPGLKRIGLTIGREALAGPVRFVVELSPEAESGL
jgi:hypothetical protein